MADILNTISVSSFIAAGVFAVVTIALWFIFKIPTIIGDLSGKSAKKSIEKMRKNNEQTGEKIYRSSNKNLERGKLTGTMENIAMFNNDEETGLLKDNLAKDYEQQATGLLLDDSTRPLNESEETAPLHYVEDKAVRKPSSVNIRIIDETMFIHTEEVI